MNVKIIVLLIGIVFSSFLCPKKNKNDFIIVSAVKQTVFGGVAGSPVVTIYKIKLKALKFFQIKCDSSYAEGKIDKLIIQLDSFNSSESKVLKKGEVVDFIYAISSEAQIGGGDYQEIIPGSPERKSPIDMDKGVLLVYQKNDGIIRYFKVENIKEQAPIYAP
ncbi:MAG: hypothetical protein Q8K70_08810 [Bacteroidota bacterium]|nr:hypothetical protein [Bacteroidota bacterium]